MRQFHSLALLLLSCATASAQQQLQALRMPSGVKDAGVYHVDSGTWTRNSSAKANFGPDILFRSDVRSGYFGVGWEGSEGVDEGISPGRNNSNTTGNTGPRDEYSVDGVEFGYCSLSTASVVWDFNFYDSYVPCDLPSGPTCVHLAGRIIGVPVPAGGFCWSALFDLSGGNEICVEADGGSCSPGYDGGGLGLDHFGWGSQWSTMDGASTGPLLDGHDPTWTPEGEGTVYQPAFNNGCGNAASGALGTEDFFAIDIGGTIAPGCYWFGGYVNTNGCGAPHNNPGGQFALNLYTDIIEDCAGSGNCNTVFCDSNPDNVGDLTLSGCDCSAGSIVLRLSSAPFDGNAAYPIIGLGTGSASPTGVSDLCLTGSPIGRYNKDIHVIAGGGFSVDLLSSNTSGANVPTIGGPLCSGNTWRVQAWMRNGMAPSRFSKGIAGTIN